MKENRPMNETENETKTDAPVYSFQKNALERVEARVREYKGHRLADLRVHFEAADGTWRPTKKGLALSVDLLGELEKAVAALRAAVETKGKSDDGRPRG